MAATGAVASTQRMLSENEDEAMPADCVWLLMGKEYRISRSIRLQWFFQNLKKVVTQRKDADIIDSTEEFEVLSILPSDPDSYTGQPLYVVPETKLPFIGRQYRFVFCIDMSPSLATIDTETGEVLIDVMFENLKNCLTGLVQPFRIPGSSLVMNPRLHVTVLAHVDVKQNRVLVQGYCVNKENVKHFLCKLKRKLQHLERGLYEDIISNNANNGAGGGEGGGNARPMGSRTSLFYMIFDGLLALQLLPDNASAGIIVITDGVFFLSDAKNTDFLLTQVRISSAVCSFLQVGTGYRRASVEFGYVPHCALMQFIATTTSGAYLATSPPVTIGDEKMNLYHKSLYCLHFQRDIDRCKIDSSQTWPQGDPPLPKWSDYLDCLGTPRDLHITSPPQHQQTMRYNQFQLKTRISSVLVVRLREGYIADGIQLTKNDTQIEVKLVWPWKEHITIEYIAKASWPLDSTDSYTTQIVVNVSGPYEFLVDIAPSAKPKNHKLFRRTVLNRFEQTMKGLDTSDSLLVHLQMFPVHPTASKIPETIAKFPLFFISANSPTPIIAHQYQSTSKSKRSSKSPEVQFAHFWKSVVTMDTTTWWNTRMWAKWWHIHNINILPKHNTPVTKGLFNPSATNQYPIVNCRAAISAFNKLLKEWCSFILLESHSYVKFMSRPGAERPHTFCLLRITGFKGLCIGMRLAFLAGTQGEDRFTVVNGLKGRLANLTSKTYLVDDSGDRLSKHAISTAESRCLIILTKQVERILVKYDYIPEEVRSSGSSTRTSAAALAAADTSMQSINLCLQETPPLNRNQYPALQQEAQQVSPRRELTQYLYNQRWVWNMRSGENAVFDAENISRILDTLLKQRLHEGFHFWIFNKGIIGLVKEVDVMVDSSEDNMCNCCVIQYVLFPPHQKTSHVAGNHLPDDSDDTEEDFQLVVEVWVEPQYGTMNVVDCPLDYINEVEYKDIPSKMFDVDAKIVTEMSSYMLLHSVCVKKDMTNCFPCADPIRPSIPSDIFKSSSIVCVPFLFQMVSLLEKSRLILSVYPMMKEMSQAHLPEANPCNMNDILLSYIKSTLRSMNDCEVPLQSNDKKLIHCYLYSRCTENSSLLQLEDSNLIFNRESLGNDIEFSCYAKSFGSRMIIMLLPGSMKDLHLLLASSGKIMGAPAKRHNLPFFIFECDYKFVQSVPCLLPSTQLDILQDYTEALNESALVPRHFNQKLPEDRSKDIAVYCQALYDHYFWALVSGMYHCLQIGYKLDRDDVELSIDLVCEETIQEIDLTEFLQTTCAHYNELVKNDYDLGSSPNDASLNVSFNSEYGMRKMTQLHKSNSCESRRSTKSAPRNAAATVCESIPLQNEIQKQFMEILGRWFHAIPGNSYYMFFKDDNTSDNTAAARDSLRSSNTTESSRGDSPLSVSDFELDTDVPADGETFTMKPTPTVEEESQQRPMFLHLTCSVHYKSTTHGSTMQPISVKNLPTCLWEIISKLDENIADTDPSSNPLSSVTISLICLTQPAEPEQDEEWVTPQKIVLTRQNSDESSQSEVSDKQRKYIMENQESQDSLDEGNTLNSYRSLPLFQQRAIERVICGIRWLLQDEIASALRLHMPLCEDNLQSVAIHVENSIKSQKAKNNCIFEQRYFMFVTGTEKATNLCLPVFVSEVKSTMLGKYKLTRVGKFWCVVVDPANQLESDAESRTMMIEEVKERAKMRRKGMSHRRSQSDSKYNRLPSREPFDALDYASGGINRTTSLPVINFPLTSHGDRGSHDSILGKGIASESIGTFHPLAYGGLWQSDGGGLGPSNGVMSPPIKITQCNSSQSSHRTSLSFEEQNGDGWPNVDDRELRRSVSYTEEKMTCETQRRSFSLSDIYRPGSSCDVIPLPQVHQPNNVNSPDDTSVDYTEGISAVSSELEEELATLRPDPNFWLFMEITEDSVLVYWHRRRSEEERKIKHQRSVYQTLLESLDRICKIVNQKILLDALYSSQACHKLLLAEDEDEVWNSNHELSSPDIRVVKDNKQQEFNSTPFSSVIHSDYRFAPGYFECELVWEEKIQIHNRLRTSNRGSDSSKALLAVRSVLSQFRVTNRQNLFVFKESHNDRNIFYFRVNEGSNEADFPRVMSPEPEDETYLFTPVREDYTQQSRASSISSLIKNEDSNTDYDRYNYERQESYQSGQLLSKISDDKCSISETSSHIHNTQDFLHFCVYGIREPGSEIKEELVKMMKTKLNKTTLDIINQALSRNLNCKLLPQDVEFIQPPGQPPNQILTLCISTFASKYLHAMVFYLHQYLLNKYCNPRYTSPDSDLTFKNFSAGKTTEYINPNDIYLYNRREKGNFGKYGIAIAYLSLVDQQGNKVVAQPWYPSPCTMELDTLGHMEILQQLVLLKKRTEGDDTMPPNMCHSIYLQFSIWTCGEIDMVMFENELMQFTKYALYDVFLEYHLLCTPICHIPNELQYQSELSCRDAANRASWGHPRATVNSASSSTATTPKLSTKSHPTLKKFSSEPTTPSDMQRESPQNVPLGNISKDDLNLVSDSPKSYPKGSLSEELDKKRFSVQDSSSRNCPQRRDSHVTGDADKKRNSLQESRHSPHQKLSRDDSPRYQQIPLASRSSFHEDEIQRKSSKIESPAIDVSNQPKTITMSELNQLKDAKDATYVMLTDAEVHESLKAISGSGCVEGQVSTWREVEMQRRSDADKRKRRRLLEHGSKGELHSNYHKCCAEIFDEMIAAGNTNIQRHEGQLTHQYMMETVMKEFKREMEDKSPDMKPKIFKAKQLSNGSTVYVPYHTSGFKADDSAIDSVGISNVYPSLIPGEIKHYVMISHNAHKWLLSMGVSEAELSDEEEGKDAQEEQSKQKFKPYQQPNSASSQERRKINDIQPPSCISSVFVPRQKFFMAVFLEKKITTYMYNFSNDVTQALEKQLKRLYAWQNVRTHLNSCLFMQKFGLYHHKNFVRDCPGKEDPDVAAFASSSNAQNLLPLMKEVSPRLRDRSKSERYQRPNNVVEFDEAFRNISPSKVLHKSGHFHWRDVVRRQAAQYQDVKNIKLHRAERDRRLKEIFDAWKDPATTAAEEIKITEDKLKLLKQHSRLIHHCGAPILVSVGQDEEVEVGGDDETIVDVRRGQSQVKGSPLSYDENSEGGMSSGALDWCQHLLNQYIAYLQTRGLILVNIANKGARHPMSVSSKVKTASLKISRTSNRSSDGKDTVFIEDQPSKYYLQQTSMAGIILLEVFCEKNYLCYNMLAFETMSLQDVAGLVTPKDQRNFFDECGRFKDLTYIRAFTYDYHIRKLFQHLCGRDKHIFPKGYQVHLLIENIIEHYPTPPRFSTCILSHELIKVDNVHHLTVMQNTIYNYLVINCSSYKLRKVDVSGGCCDDLDYLDPGDFLLTFPHTAKFSMQPGDIWRSRREIMQFDGNGVLHYKPTLQNEVIKWPYYLVLVNRTEFYPRPSFVPGKRRQKVDDTSASESELIAQRSRLISKHANSTGSLRPSVSISQALSHNLTQKFSPKDMSLSPDTSNNKNMSHSSESEYSFSMTTMSQLGTKDMLLSAQKEFITSEMKFVEEERNKVSSFLSAQVLQCLGNCLRDLVWNSLLVTDTLLEEESIKRTKKKSSTASLESTHVLINCIKEWKNENRMDLIPNNLNQSHATYTSLMLLLNHNLVWNYEVTDIDKSISTAFSYVQPGVQQKLIKTLNSKYNQYTRQFLSEDGETTLLCIINQWNLDMMMLVIADEREKKMKFSAVYRSEPTFTPLQSMSGEQLQARDRFARQHIESVITCLCYDMWLQLLPS